MEAWLEGLLLPLALAGPADDALVSRSLGCYDSYAAGHIYVLVCFCSQNVCRLDNALLPRH